MSTATATHSDIDRNGEVVATVDHYAEAQRLVDHLSDEGFPVEHVAIVGRDLRFVEHVTGRRRYGRAALEGAGSGAVTGAMVGLLLSIFTLWDPVAAWFTMLLWWTLIGTIVGTVLGLLGQAMRRGRRDFSSRGLTEAGVFDVAVQPEHAERARRTIEPVR